jgi:hypothetical protein
MYHILLYSFCSMFIIWLYVTGDAHMNTNFLQFAIHFCEKTTYVDASCGRLRIDILVP